MFKNLRVSFIVLVAVICAMYPDVSGQNFVSGLNEEYKEDMKDVIGEHMSEELKEKMRESMEKPMNKLHHGIKKFAYHLSNDGFDMPTSCNHPCVKLNDTNIIYPENQKRMVVFCEEFHGEVWTRVLNKVNKNDLFNKNFGGYKAGFGSAKFNSFIGLKAMKNMVLREPMELAIVATTKKNGEEHLHFINYDYVHLDGSFRLSLGKKGEANMPDLFKKKNNLKFYVNGVKNLKNECKSSKAGFWFDNDKCNGPCLACNGKLNGLELKSVKVLIKPKKPSCEIEWNDYEEYYDEEDDEEEEDDENNNGSGKDEDEEDNEPMYPTRMPNYSRSGMPHRYRSGMYSRGYRMHSGASRAYPKMNYKWMRGNNRQ